MVKALDAYRKRLDELEGLTVKTDKDVLAGAQALLQPLREIERAMRGRGDNYMKVGAIWRARRIFIQQFRTLEKNLTAETQKLVAQ